MIFHNMITDIENRLHGRVPARFAAGLETFAEFSAGPRVPNCHADAIPRHSHPLPSACRNKTIWHFVWGIVTRPLRRTESIVFPASSFPASS
jgi:hypothetical protein